MIKRTLITLTMLLLAGYLAVALTLFNRPSSEAVCREVKWKIKETGHAEFVTHKGLETLLRQGKLYPKGKAMSHVQCRQIEDYLAKNPMIENVECYKGPAGNVCIEVTQRIPILHIMADNGEQYFLDSKGNVMPRGQYATHLAIVTGAITQKTARPLVYDLGKYMMEEPFWNDQIEQIHVTAAQELELVPRVGNHIVFLGKPKEIPEKLEKLKTFYLKALNTVGWNKYSRISVEFTNQIICTKKEK